jgi:hypothetical protein
MSGEKFASFGRLKQTDSILFQKKPRRGGHTATLSSLRAKHGAHLAGENPVSAR